MIPQRFSTEPYLTDSYENSSSRVKTKCKKYCIYSSGISLLFGTWGLFFTLGYHYNQINNCDNSLMKDII
jgi:hypothetical protein